MSVTQSSSLLFEELASLFASAPRPEQILEFRPSDAATQRASELLELNRQGRLGDELREELDQYEQAELLMRLVKARIRAGEAHDARPA